MNVRTIGLIQELSDNYADRLDDEQLDVIDELLDTENWGEAIRRVVEFLDENQAIVTEDEYDDLEELCETYGVDLELLDDLDVV